METLASLLTKGRLWKDRRVGGRPMEEVAIAVDLNRNTCRQDQNHAKPRNAENPMGQNRHLDVAGRKLPRDNFCLSIVSQLPSPRGSF